MTDQERAARPGPADRLVADRSEAERPSRRQWIGLVALLTGTFVVQVDFFIVNVALPTIQRDLSATLSQVQLMAVSYGGAFAISVVTGGRLGDLFGRKRLFTAGLVAFAAASLLCGVAWTGWMLVGARVGQGFAAAMVMPQALGSLHAMFTDRGRDRAFAVFGIAMGLAWVSGIALGGLLVGANLPHLGWRVIFLINLPLVAVALVASRAVTESTRPSGPTLDLAGVSVLAAVVALLIFPLIQGRQAGWPLWTYLCLAGSAAGCGVLAWVEWRVRARGRSPVISPELFRDRTFRRGLLVIVVFFLGPPGFFLLTTLYLQAVLRFSATQAGLVLLPFGAVFVISSHWIKRLKERMGDRVIVLGVVIMMVGLGAFILIADRDGPHLTVLATTVPLALIGMGQAFVTTPLYEMLLRDVPAEIAATASGVFTTVQLVSQSVSVAVLVIIFAALARTQAAAPESAGAPALRATLAAAGAPPAQDRAALDAYHACVRAALSAVIDGSAPQCAGPPAERVPVTRAADQVFSAAVREAYTRTLLVNLLVLLASGLVVAVGIRRAPPGRSGGRRGPP
jgi:EmrB/QacA subfamily drug resistance transporter